MRPGPLTPIARIRTAGGIVLGEHATVAMVCHKNDNGRWFFPKGHVESGETEEETARREIMEETGLVNLEYLDDLGAYERYHMTPDGQIERSEIKEMHMFLFGVHADSALSPAFEIGEAKWIPASRVAVECTSARDRAWFASIYHRIKEAVRRD